MKKKLTTVAVLGLVVACGFTQSAEANWFTDGLKTAVNFGLKKAGAYAADQYCKGPALSGLKFTVQSGTCATAIHTKNHGNIKYKAVRGGVPAILGTEPEDKTESSEEAWTSGWIDFLTTDVGNAWYHQNKDKGKIPEDVADIVGDEMEDHKSEK